MNKKKKYVRDSMLVFSGTLLGTAAVISLTRPPMPLSEASGKSVKIVPGLAGSQDVDWCENQGWHAEGSLTALDYHWHPSGGEGAGAAPAYLELAGWSGGGALLVSPVDHSTTGSACHGVDLVFKDYNNNSVTIGRANYVHINPASDIINSGWASWKSESGTNSHKLLGNVRASDSASCWQGDHLHQSGASGWTRQSPGAYVNPAGDCGGAGYKHASLDANNWMFQLNW